MPPKDLSGNTTHSLIGKEEKGSSPPTPPTAGARREQVPLLRTCLCDKVCAVNGQWVGFGVKDPVLKRQHIVFTEQKIEVPAIKREEEKEGCQLLFPCYSRPQFHHPLVVLKFIGVSESAAFTSQFSQGPLS